MKLLLHVCCAPCAIHPLREAIKDGYEVTGFFYNPNIHPPAEYERRKEETEKFFKSEKVPLIIPEYNTDEFFKTIDKRVDPPARCYLCWALRFLKTASMAKEHGFRAFTSTLLVSPYQEHAVLKIVGKELSEKNDVHFYYRDFRPAFRLTHREARELGMYCQNYCGCAFSMVERWEKR